MDYRIVFLIFVLITFFLYRMSSKKSFFAGIINRQAILSSLTVLALIGSVISFVVLMTNQDPKPLIRQAGYWLSFQEVVSYADAIPPYLTDKLSVKDVVRMDTDGDGFREWVVFYAFDQQGGKMPLQGFDQQDGKMPVRAVIYDNDLGNPPLIFPYPLQSPNNEYLTQGKFVINNNEQVTSDKNGADGTDLPEIFIWGYPDVQFGLPIGTKAVDLTIFHVEKQTNVNVWEAPTNNPPRYRSMGSFHGDGGTDFDATTKEVSVIEQSEYIRSQLARRSVYALSSVNNGTYMDSTDPTKLGRPIVSTLDFYPDPPDEILSTEFPEKIVLAFYASTCGSTSKDLCNRASLGWKAVDFLAKGQKDGPTPKAMVAWNERQADYFGLPAFSGIKNLSVEKLRFYTEQPDETTIVEITFTVNNSPTKTAKFKLQMINGHWKIVEKLDLQVSALGN